MNEIYAEFCKVSDVQKDKIAILDKGKCVTYTELREKVEIVKAFFTEQNISGRNIAVLASKSADSIASIVGIIASGNVFMPLHKGWSAHRVEELVNFAQVPMVLFDDSVSAIETYGEANSIKINDVLSKKSDDRFLSMNSEKIYYDPCYLYFTSGSTGERKGVLGSQKSLVHFVKWEQEFFEIGCDDKVSVITNMTFDPFLRDIFVPLLTGATACIPNTDENFIDMKQLRDWIEECDISVIHIVPSLFKELLPYMSNADLIPGGLRYIFFAGEVLYSNIISDFYRNSLGRIKLVNLYGPTETTLAKFYHIFSDRDMEDTIVPVGRIQPGASFELVPEKKITVGGDNLGEIYIHTAYSSYGYYKNEAYNKERFFEDKNKNVVYKTGDCGYLRDDGELVCVGRNDDQIKIHGVKVNLKEIELALLSIDGIESATVLKKKEKTERECIVAFYVSHEKMDKAQMRSELETVLPLYMIPSYLVSLDEMPHLSNGKIDRRKLLDMDIDDYRAAIKKPANDYEQKLLTIWQDVLGYDDIGTDMDFFAAGGYSITAVRLIGLVNERFLSDMSPSDVYRLRTIEKMVGFVKEHENNVTKENNRTNHCCESCPATPIQVGIFMSELGTENSTIYNMPAAIRIRDGFDRAKVEKALNMLISRHPALGYSFSFTDGKLMQNSGKLEKIQLKIEDLREEQFVDESALFRQYIKPFEIEKEPLFRSILFRVKDTEQILFWDVHHIISDGLSEEIMKAEFTAAYMGNEIPKEEFDYMDYALSKKSSTVYENDISFWKSEYEQLPQSLELPTDKTRMPVRDLAGKNYSKSLERDLTNRIKIAASRYKTTPYVITLAAFYSTLAMYSNQRDIVVGTVYEGDRGEYFKNTVGPFIKLYALRNSVCDTKDMNLLISETARCVNGMMEHNSCSYNELLKMLNLGTDRSRNPLFDVSFFFQNYEKAQDTDIVQKNEDDSARFEIIQVNRDMAKYDLTCYIIPSEGRYALTIEYASNLFDERYIEGFAECYEDRLRTIVESEDSSVVEMGQQLWEKLLDYGKTKERENRMQPIHKQFTKKASECPDIPAVVFHNKVLTYRELDEKSDCFAKQLIGAGSHKGDMIGILMERSQNLMVAILGVLKSGCAYLPLDPDYPKERIRNIIENSQCELLVVDYIRDEYNISQIEIDKQDITGIDKVSNEVLSGRADVDMESLSYVIYTSGSTGKPKGVMLKHINEVNFIEGISEYVNFVTNNRVLCITTVSFDIFVLESMAPLLNGATVYMADRDEQYDAEKLNKLVMSNSIQVIQMTPSRLKMFMANKEQTGFLKEAKVVLVGGEPVDQSVTDAVFEINQDVRVLDVYGPTETCVWSTVKELHYRKEITVGRPIKNTDVYVLDDKLSPMPYGLPGQLFIGGSGLARGYFGREDLTNEAFIDNPFCAGTKIYKTGDYVKWGPQNELRFLGRKDAQIKIRGYRVELTDIEANTMQLGGIKTCACVVKKQVDGNDGLVAYYLSENELDEIQLHCELKAKLPAYMIPSRFIRLEAMPMTPNGKINKKELVARTDEEKAVVYESVRPDKTAGVIYDIWKEILGHGGFDTDTPFIDAGGNSFLLVMMFNRINELHPDVMSIGELFAYPTIEKIAGLIDEKSKKPLSTVRIDMQPSFDGKDIIRSEQIELKEDEYENIDSFCKGMNIVPGTLWNSVFAMMLSHLSKESKVHIYAVDHDRLAEIAVDFTAMETPQKVFAFFGKNSLNYRWGESEEYVGNNAKDKITVGFGDDIDDDILALLDMTLKLNDDGRGFVLSANGEKAGLHFLDKLAAELYKNTLKLIRR